MGRLVWRGTAVWRWHCWFDRPAFRNSTTKNLQAVLLVQCRVRSTIHYVYVDITQSSMEVKEEVMELSKKRTTLTGCQCHASGGSWAYAGVQEYTWGRELQPCLQCHQTYFCCFNPYLSFPVSFMLVQFELYCLWQFPFLALNWYLRLLPPLSEKLARELTTEPVFKDGAQ